MRVAIVCPYDMNADGGVQQICRELAARLQAAGDEAMVVGPGDGVGTDRTVRVRANRSTVPIDLDPRSVRHTRRRLEEADVVHVHEPLVPVVGWAALTEDRPRVATFHADPARWTRRFYRLTARPAATWFEDAVLTAASPVAAAAVPGHWGEVEVIPNAIDLAAYRWEVNRVSRRVVFLGRDDPRKGLHVLLRAWPMVRAAQPEAELVVMGRAEPRAIPGVSFRGRVSEEEKARTLSTSAVMVAPNLGGESFGITVAEAMAAGCAVVASDLPAFRAVLDGQGALVPPGNVEALAREVRGLLADPDRAEEAGRRARESARRFDWSRVLGRYRRAYESAVHRHGTTIHGRKE